jgi:hypothetical protein
MTGVVDQHRIPGFDVLDQELQFAPDGLSRGVLIVEFDELVEEVVPLADSPNGLRVLGRRGQGIPLFVLVDPNGQQPLFGPVGHAARGFGQHVDASGLGECRERSPEDDETDGEKEWVRGTGAFLIHA